MYRSIVIGTVLLSAAVLCACQPHSSQSAASQGDQRLQEYERQVAKVAEQQRIADQQLKKAEEQQQRMEALMRRWEAQADRYDAILARWEKQERP